MNVYRVETAIGSFDVWKFGPNGIWFVADCDTDENVYRGRSFDDAMRAISEVADNVR